MDPAAENDDYDEDDIPLHHKRPFGAGLSRQKVAFVPATDGPLATGKEVQPSVWPSQSLGDLYLSMVLPKAGEEGTAITNPPADETERSASAPPPPSGSGNNTTDTETIAFCEICHLPLHPQSAPPADQQGDDGAGSSGTGSGASYPRDAHASSIAHQVCLAHSHPPSALDRSRMGLAYLSSRGWDPDARQGLGAAHQGIVYPLKPRPKDDTLGIGVVVPKDTIAAAAAARKEGKVQKLDAKKMRRVAAEDRRRAERLREQLFSSVEVEKYLGSNG